MYDKNRDNDTLGGRIWRAREAAGYSAAKFSRTLGIRKETLDAWESDRSEPRANRLVTMAGLLSVSPSWLLHGIGESPLDENVSDEVQILRAQLARIKELREQTSISIANMERAIERMALRERES
jgi:HTH-type transcriptional regulator, cell division transcriptional repressor